MSTCLQITPLEMVRFRRQPCFSLDHWQQPPRDDFTLSTGFTFPKALLGVFSESFFFAQHSPSQARWTFVRIDPAGRRLGNVIFPEPKRLSKLYGPAPLFSVILRVLQVALSPWQSRWTGKSPTSLQPRGVRLMGYVQVTGIVWDRYSTEGRNCI